MSEAEIKARHGIQYWISESNGLVSSIEFSKCDEEHKRDIMGPEGPCSKA